MDDRMRPVHDGIPQLWHQAQQFTAQGRVEEAMSALARLIVLEPGNTNAHLLSSAVAYTQGHLRASAQYALDAARTPIADAVVLGNVVMALLRTGEVAQAHACMQSPIIAKRLPPTVLLRLANAQQAMECHAEAIGLIERAIASGADDAGARFLHSIELMFMGRKQEAEAELLRCLDMGIHSGRASLMLARLRKQTAQTNHIDAIRLRLGQAAPGSEDQAALEFALYKELEDLGEYDDAWNALARGNARMAALLHPDPARQERLVDGLIERTHSIPMSDATASGVDAASQSQPIFIIGMPRSGTTLLDRILGGHSEVTSVGELGDFARQIRWAADHVGGEPIDEMLLGRLSGLDLTEVGRRYLMQSRWRSNTRFYIDKLPVNYFLAGLIAHALPQARILHLVRDPMAVCFSNYRAFFGAGYGYSYDLNALAGHYRDYRRLMRHWHRLCPGRILDVDYDRLTSEPEHVAREISMFCGLDFEPRCLDLAQNRSPIATLSAMQFEHGIRPSESAAWRQYTSHLSVLQTALADVSI
jgi:Flp pilus assembly protein TadD